MLRKFASLAFLSATFMSMQNQLAFAARPGTETPLVFDGGKGAWKDWAGDETGGYYICGAEIQYLEDRGRWDDTAANGLRVVYCHLLDWNNNMGGGEEVTIYEAETSFEGGGDWQGMVMCPEDSFVDGAVVQYHDNSATSEDGTAINGLKIRCRNYNTGVREWMTVFEGERGTWQTPITRDDKYVKLARIRYHRCALLCDSTGMNSIQIQYEYPNHGMSQAQPIGQWSNQGTSSPDQVRSSTQSIRTFPEAKLLTKEQRLSVVETLKEGFEFESAGIDVEGEYSKKVTNLLRSFIELGKDQTLSFTCNGTSPTGNWTLWQWEMNQLDDSTGPGFTLLPNQYVCTDSPLKEPRCPVGYCLDWQCQECECYPTCPTPSPTIPPSYASTIAPSTVSPTLKPPSITDDEAVVPSTVSQTVSSTIAPTTVSPTSKTPSTTDDEEVVVSSDSCACNEYSECGYGLFFTRYRMHRVVGGVCIETCSISAIGISGRYGGSQSWDCGDCESCGY